MSEENKDLELQSGSHYGTNTATSGSKKHTFTETAKDGAESEPSDLVDEDEVKELWWVKLFPFLLKWSWLKRRIAKKKEDSKSETTISVHV